MAGADGVIMQLGGRDVRVWEECATEYVFSPRHFLISTCKKLMIGGVRAASGSELVRSTQRRERKARSALVGRGCACSIQRRDVVMKYMLVVQLFHRRAAQILRTYGTAPSRLEGDDFVLLDGFDEGALKLFQGCSDRAALINMGAHTVHRAFHLGQ
jgi:hypothetical protein